MVKCLYKRRYAYAKAGVYLGDLMPITSAHIYLFTSAQPTSRSQKLMSTIDQIQAKMGIGTIKLAGVGTNYAWKMRSGRKSPNYTTSWDGLVKVSFSL